jgi:hypothetical protein
MTRARLLSWHEDEWLIARLGEPIGKACLLVATALLVPGVSRIPVVVALVLLMLLPGRRAEILSVGALWVLYQRLPDAVVDAGPMAVLLGMASALGLLVVCFAAARRFAALPAIVRRNPILSLHTLLLLLLGVCIVAATRGYGGVVWGAGVVTLAAVLPFLLWRASYLMLSGRRGSAVDTRFIDHLMYALPLWGGTGTPYGKGHDHLRQHSVVEARSLARCRASGVKLLLLALAWRWVSRGFTLLGSDSGLVLPGEPGSPLMVPNLATMIAAGPAAFSFGARWLATLLELFHSVVELAARGHLFIGVLRLFGFSVFRNTYKPLLSRSIVEFWNRYYYYFKELMVEFFFYPMFVALSKHRAEVRLVAAVLAAATVGNFYYHVVLDHRTLLDADLDAALQALGGRGIYSIILGVGVAASMLRERRKRAAARTAGPQQGRLRVLRAILGVWLFFALLQVWNVDRHRLPVARRAAFLASLFIPVEPNGRPQ